MLIDPSLAQSRLDDPSNILNSLFKRSSVTTPDLPDLIDIDLPNTNTNTNTNKNTDLPNEELRLTPEELDAATLASLGLNPRVKLPENSSVLKLRHCGKLEGTKEMPNETKELLGTLAQFTDQKDIAKSFNVHQSTVSRLENGHSIRHKELKQKIDHNVGKVVDKALEKLLSTIDSMDEHRIEQLTIKDAATVASMMSKVVSNMSPKEQTNINTGAQLIVYAPAQFNENKYEVVELS